MCNIFLFKPETTGAAIAFCSIEKLFCTEEAVVRSCSSGLKPCNFIKKRLQHNCLPVKFRKFLRTPFFTDTSGGCFCSVNMTKFIGKRQ